LIRYRADWVLPIAAPPIRGGWVAVDGGRVAALGAGPSPAADASDVDLGAVALMPGLVNAHTHLELSHLRDRVPPAAAFVDWVQHIIETRRRTSDGDAPAIEAAIVGAIAEATVTGTAVVGDISNTLATVAPLEASALAGVVFFELIRFRAADPEQVVDEARRKMAACGGTDRVRLRLAAHAPYSVAPLVFRAIAETMRHDGLTPCSVHLSESAEEVEFIRTGRGPWRALLEALGSWDPGWTPPGGTPVEFLDACGFLGEGVVAVHGVQMSRADLERLASRGVTLVTCPRSNAHTGAGRPPIEEFYASGVRVAVGTDSLASAPDLSVFAELAAIRRLAPSVPARRLLDSATQQGARALGFDADYGTIAPGKSARLIAVTVPPDIEDVEEYLVSGIEPARVKWLAI
jgi:aminodeoxyfutalosine deaminase